MVVIIFVIVVLAIIAFFASKKKRKSIPATQTKRSVSTNKKRYNGILLSDHKKKDGKLYVFPDDGWVKGWVSSPNTAVVCSHSNPSKDWEVHSYDSLGIKAERKIVDLVHLENDVTLIKVDQPWPDTVTKFLLADFVPDEYVVMHLDGTKSKRILDEKTKSSTMICGKDENVTKPIIPGESGLPWFSGSRVLSHSYRGEYGIGPNYPLMKKQILEIINQMK